MFIDNVKVILKSGNGGNGCISFKKEKYISKGGPDGGNGGHGGNIIFECDSNLYDLRLYISNGAWKAEDGYNGRNKKKHGRNGKNCYLKVCPNTTVVEFKTGKIVLNSIKENEKIIILKGGKGGLGNICFKNSINQVPRKNTEGEKTQTRVFLLYFKKEIDIALIGFPNAGKSSLINNISRKSKINYYPFTTKTPVFNGIQTLKKYISFVDLPPITNSIFMNIYKNKFLSHIENAKLLILMIEVQYIYNLEKSYKVLIQELFWKNPLFLNKKRIIILNKIDLLKNIKDLKYFIQKIKIFYKKNRLLIRPVSCLKNIIIKKIIIDLIKRYIK